jgi:predicted O-linked N-acetylglucosamine transferase (SPINDLY family)
MATLSQALGTALAHYQAGQFDLAGEICRRVLAAEPRQSDALHLLGVMARQRGDLAQAVEYLEQAVAADPTNAEYPNSLGIAWKAQGQLERAVACYRRALQLKPDYAEAHNNLGSALCLLGNAEGAAASCRRALGLRPDMAEAYSNLGNALRDLGQPDQAVACCQRALQLRPQQASFHYNLGTAREAQGRPAEAEACYRQALRLKPELAEAHLRLGNVLHAKGQRAEALACLCRAVELNPHSVEAQLALANVHQELGQLDAALAGCQRALQLDPERAETHNNLGAVYRQRGQLSEARACFEQALQLQPDLIEALANLGGLLHDLGRTGDAAACYERAVEAHPDFAKAHNGLGVVRQAQDRLDEAEACFRRAIELTPDFAEAHNNLGNICHRQRRPSEAIACYEQALRLMPDNTGAHSNLLCTLHYREQVTLDELAAAHAEYQRRHAAPLRATWRPHSNARDPERRLRVGFVSSDLGAHPVGRFLVRVLENLDRAQCETVCYSDRFAADETTVRLRAAAGAWHDVCGLSDNQLAEQVRGDRIDVLFDLAGHTARNRLLVFARKPAPIQITWLGYVGTTGLEAMDYLLADAHQVPAGAEPHYVEQVLRMPHGYACFDPDTDLPVGPLPALAAGHVTFGCFNNPAKITPSTVALWARILDRVPRARLRLKFKGLEGQLGRELREQFALQGIDAGRLELAPGGPRHEFLAAYQHVDLALDTSPYSGGLTTCEALWMGVPVVTCPGETFASRHSLGHLTTAGLAEMIAADADQYVELAVRLAHDVPCLAELRARLRPQVAASPLCDGRRFAADLAELLRGAWRRWCG